MLPILSICWSWASAWGDLVLHRLWLLPWAWLVINDAWTRKKRPINKERKAKDWILYRTIVGPKLEDLYPLTQWCRPSWFSQDSWINNGFQNWNKRRIENDVKSTSNWNYWRIVYGRCPRHDGWGWSVLDSMGTVNWLMKLENRFGIRDFLYLNLDAMIGILLTRS